MKPMHVFWTICAVMFLVVFIVTGCQSREDRYWSDVSKGLEHVYR